MTPNQTLAGLTARAIQELDRVMAETRPDIVLVQGDTTTTFAGALAAFYRRIPVGHVEAGLRTYDRYRPYPEELNRVMTSSLADIHFAPTKSAQENLRRAGVCEASIHVTGNTVIDALLDVACRPYQFAADLASTFTTPGIRPILVTAHRRENHGEPLENICRALESLVDRFDDIEIVYPVHMNPKVSDPVTSRLGARERIRLTPPMDYQGFVNAVKHSYLVISDSGGLQEEAPALGKPVLVLRESTERPEAIEAGTAKLVGTDPDRIVAEASRLLEDEDAYATMARARNPFGDGKAAGRIFSIVDRFLGE
jgi:UDP-N-acetylglucosamine 2-epimerase